MFQFLKLIQRKFVVYISGRKWMECHLDCHSIFHEFRSFIVQVSKLENRNLVVWKKTEGAPPCLPFHFSCIFIIENGSNALLQIVTSGQSANIAVVAELLKRLRAGIIMTTDISATGRRRRHFSKQTHSHHLNFTRALQRCATVVMIIHISYSSRASPAHCEIQTSRQFAIYNYVNRNADSRTFLQVFVITISISISHC